MKLWAAQKKLEGTVRPGDAVLFVTEGVERFGIVAGTISDGEFEFFKVNTRDFGPFMLIKASFLSETDWDDWKNDRITEKLGLKSKRMLDALGNPGRRAKGSR